MRWVVALLVACGSSSAPAPGSAAPPKVDDTKWACAADADCINSCSQGAVSRAWYGKARVQECEDGCDNQLAAAPKCIDKQCVAFRETPDGKTVMQSPECTHKP